MDLDILKRKIRSRNYEIPLLDNYYVAFKMINVDGSDYTVESTDISKNNYIITVYKYEIDNSSETVRYLDVPVAKVKCKNKTDFMEALDQINGLEKGTKSYPFDQILSTSNVVLVKKKKWMVKRQTFWRRRIITMKKLIIGLAGFGLGWIVCSIAF